MRAKTIVNGKGEPQAARIEIQIEGKGGALGIQAVENLIEIVNMLKSMKTEEELKEHILLIYGYGICCQNCGFLTEKSVDDLMYMVNCLAENELIKIKAERR